MTSSAALDYGRCPCGGTYENRVVEVTIRSGPISLSDVPQGVCPLCGSRIYKAEILERIEALMKGERKTPGETKPHRET